MIIKTIKPIVFTSNVLFLIIQWDPFGSMIAAKGLSSCKHPHDNDTNKNIYTSAYLLNCSILLRNLSVGAACDSSLVQAQDNIELCRDLL